MTKYILGIIILFQAFGSSAQDNTGSIKGRVLDKEYNEEPLSFANVLLKGTTKGITTDMDGFYVLDGLDPGTYIVEFSYTGYETITIPNVEVVAGKATEVNTIMAATAATLDEVTITTVARRESEVALLLDQKGAVTMKESIGADELSRKGIGNASEAVAQISGISKQVGSSDVFVRGLGDRYQNTTLNNLPLPSNNVNKKNINLDLFSSDVIENIAVTKAYSSKFYADFSAGNVNIDSKEYTGKGYFAISTGSSINSNAVGEDFVRSEGPSYFGFYNRYNNDPFAVVLSHGIDPQDAASPINFNGSVEGGYSIRFKNDSKLSLFATANFENGYEFLKGPAVDFTNDVKLRFDNVEEYIYSSTTTAMANATYRLNDKNKFSYNSFFVNSASDRVGYFGTEGRGFNRDGFTGDEGFYQMNVQFNQDMIFVNQLLATHNIKEDFKIDWALGYNKVLSDEPDRKRISLENYQFALDNDPDTNPVYYNNNSFDNQRFFQSIDEDEINAFVNAEKLFSENIKLNFGYNLRVKERDFINRRYGYNIFDRDANPVTNVNDFNSFFTLDNLNTNPPSDLNGLYDIRIARNPNGLDQTLGLINVPQSYENIYTGNLDINAGFLNAELKYGEKWLFVPGVRFEHINQSIVYDVINPVPTDTGIRDVDINVFLPSLNVKYSLNDDMNFRFSFSNTISLPEFKEAANFVYEDVTQRIGGNPDLLGKADGTGEAYSDIYNYDLKYEWFPTRGELLSVSLFSKFINDPVNRVVATDATGNQRFFRTGDVATVLGVELEVRKNLLLDTDEKALLSVGGNFAYTDTKQDLNSINTSDGFTFGTSFGSRTSDELQGASKYILNTNLNYSPSFENYKPQATLALSYFSDRIYALGSGDLGNIVEKGVPTLNFILKNEINENLEINFSVTNILNPDVSLVRENTGAADSPILNTDTGQLDAGGNPILIRTGLVNSSGDVTLREFNRGVNFGLSVKYKF